MISMISNAINDNFSFKCYNIGGTKTFGERIGFPCWNMFVIHNVSMYTFSVSRSHTLFKLPFWIGA